MDGIINILSLVNPYQWSKQMGGGRKGRKSKKTKTKAQKMAVANKAKYGGTAKAAAANKAAGKKAAGERHAKFKQTGVQTFGGKKTNFSTAEKKRIEKAGYSVDGYSKAPFKSQPQLKSETQLQVDRDNQMYGNTFPSGGLNISKEGQALAEQNKAQFAAANANYNTGSLLANAGPSSPIKFYEGLGYRPWPGAAGLNDDKIRWKTPITLPPITKASADLGGNLIASSDLSGLSIGDPKQTKFTPTMPGLAKSLGFDTESTKDFSGFTGIKSPSTYGYPSSDAVDKAAGLTSGGLNIGGSTETNQQGAGIKNRLSRVLGGTLDAITKNKYDFDNLGGQTAEGKIAGENRKKLYNTVMDALSTANTLKGTKYLTQKLPTNEGTKSLSINPSDAASDLSKVYGVDNSISGYMKAIMGEGAGDYSGIANTVSDARAVAEGGAKAFKKLSPSDQQNLVTSAGNIIDNSKVFQSLGEQYTGSDTFKSQTQNTLAAFNKALQEASQDTKGRVDPINKVLKDFNKIEGLDVASKYLKTLDNPDLTIRQRLEAAYNPASPKAEALSFDERELLGSAGNLLIGGKLSDVFRENNPYGEEGRGTTFSPTDSANLIANTMIAANTPGSLTQQRLSEIGALTDKGTKVTPGTLIKGVIPKFGSSGSFQRRRSSNKPNAVSSLGMGATTSVEEILPLPTTKAIGGTNATNLAQLQKQAYNNQMSAYGMNPNYFATIMQPKFTAPKKKFSQYFNRDYIPKFA